MTSLLERQKNVPSCMQPRALWFRVSQRKGSIIITPWNFAAEWLLGFHGQNSQATMPSHEALLFSKNYNSQYSRKLRGPWAGGAYRLILGTTPTAISDQTSMS